MDYSKIYYAIDSMRMCLLSQILLERINGEIFITHLLCSITLTIYFTYIMSFDVCDYVNLAPYFEKKVRFRQVN